MVIEIEKRIIIHRARIIPFVRRRKLEMGLFLIKNCNSPQFPLLSVVFFFQLPSLIAADLTPRSRLVPFVFGTKVQFSRFLFLFVAFPVNNSILPNTRDRHWWIDNTLIDQHSSFPFSQVPRGNRTVDARALKDALSNGPTLPPACHADSRLDPPPPVPFFTGRRALTFRYCRLSLLWMPLFRYCLLLLCIFLVCVYHTKISEYNICSWFLFAMYLRLFERR